MKGNFFIIKLIVFSGVLFFLSQFFWYTVFGSYGWLGGVIVGAAVGVYFIRKIDSRNGKFYIAAIYSSAIFISVLIFVDAFFLFKEKSQLINFVALNGTEFDLSIGGYFRYLFFKVPIISLPYMLLVISFVAVCWGQQLRGNNFMRYE